MSDFVKLDPEIVIARLTSRLDPLDAPERYDEARVLRDPALYEAESLGALVDSAVLVPLMQRSEGLFLLFTERSASMPSHAGQNVFPGGRLHADDADHVAAALREAEEEIGLTPDRVRILGKSGLIAIGSGHKVIPVVGLVDPHGFEPRPSAREVADWFEVPFDHFLDVRNFQERKLGPTSRLPSTWMVPYQGRDIWGATAAMLWTLQDLVNNPRYG